MRAGAPHLLLNSLFDDLKHLELPAPVGLPAGVVLRLSRPRLEFWPDAMAASTNTLTICDGQGIAPPRAIVISQTGRVRLADAAAGSCDA